MLGLEEQTTRKRNVNIISLTCRFCFHLEVTSLPQQSDLLHQAWWKCTDHPTSPPSSQCDKKKSRPKRAPNRTSKSDIETLRRAQFPSVIGPQLAISPPAVDAAHPIPPPAMVSGPDTASTLPTARPSPGGFAATPPGGPARDHVPPPALPNAPPTAHATVENMTGTEEGDRRPPYLHVG